MEASSPTPAVAVRAWAQGRRIWLELSDQRIASFPADKYPLLARAPDNELAKVTLRVQGRALRWESLDEDIWIEDAINGRFPRPHQAIAV
jgi:hypothetical protein